MRGMLFPIALLLLAIALIYLGARWLVEGASELAAHFGVSSIVIGLTIVGIGTSAPELMLAIISGAEGSGSISAGNVFGANVANATYILGSCAIALPLLVKFREIRREAIFMFVALAATAAMAIDGSISRLEGALLIVLFIILMALTIRSLMCCRPSKEVEKEFEATRPETEPPLKSALFVIVGLALLVLGTELAVESATEIATILGVSEFLIGLTVITFGTTTPEFASSLLPPCEATPTWRWATSSAPSSPTPRWSWERRFHRPLAISEGSSSSASWPSFSSGARPGVAYRKRC